MFFWYSQRFSLITNRISVRPNFSLKKKTFSTFLCQWRSSWVQSCPHESNNLSTLSCTLIISGPQTGTSARFIIRPEFSKQPYCSCKQSPFEYTSLLGYEAVQTGLNTRRHIPEGLNLHQHCEIFKSPRKINLIQWNVSGYEREDKGRRNTVVLLFSFLCKAVFERRPQRAQDLISGAVFQKSPKNKCTFL